MIVLLRAANIMERGFLEAGNEVYYHLKEIV